jgi:hypothetical protein
MCRVFRSSEKDGYHAVGKRASERPVSFSVLRHQHLLSRRIARAERAV